MTSCGCATSEEPEEQYYDECLARTSAVAGPVYTTLPLREWGADLPWAWPTDALQHERKSGEQIREMFEGHGLNMLSEFAQFEDGLLTGRWKVFRHLNDYFNEFGMYHRRDGVIVKENEDIMDASRYAHMMLRFAESMRQTWTKEALNVQEEWV